MMGWLLPSSLLGMENAISFAFTQFLLLIPVVFINFKYYRMGFKTLFHGSPNMDSLIAIAPAPQSFMAFTPFTKSASDSVMGIWLRFTAL